MQCSPWVVSVISQLPKTHACYLSDMIHLARIQKQNSSCSSLAAGPHQFPELRRSWPSVVHRLSAERWMPVSHTAIQFQRRRPWESAKRRLGLSARLGSTSRLLVTETTSAMSGCSFRQRARRHPSVDKQLSVVLGWCRASLNETCTSNV